ncbi:glycoside hydrolase family 5 protein [Suillus paluster]|uniref:glycoside hydrolase family 5 protein n=1 Tax=Suillus paluster TaxID=48578 RepID=UPI001B886996|nr:glycoside hydrolase family 5 protein [Suillus paluster]KAG1728724.1 glycoside hydrolase family 5 protein [Suillus paluster]
MPRVPSVDASFIHTLHGNFVDNAGRTLLLRGVNLSGSSKAPVNQPSQVLDGFWEEAKTGSESFVGRPLKLDDADEHLARLRGWGFNMLRFPITWEALEHAGPGKYDYEFMDYTIEILRKCKAHGFKVYMNPHQDTWSRFSGGSGAPYWTLVACGFNPSAFSATQAAIIHCEYPTPASRNPAELPAMIWSTNYGRLVSHTMFALFFGGSTFAPKCIIDGVNIQEYLQTHFANAFGKLAERVAAAGDLLDEVVIGWDSMNEPAEGLISWNDLNAYPVEQGSTLKKGTVPSPAQSFRLGMGQVQTLDNYTFGSMGPKRDGSVTIDPNGVKAWSDPSTEPGGIHPRWGWRRDPGWTLGTCVWALHDVWDVQSGYVMQPDYFARIPGTEEPARFLHTFFLPQCALYLKAVRAHHPQAIAFVQPPVFARPPPIPEEILQGRACYSTHYYDGLTLVTRHWNWFNADALGLLRGKYSTQIQALRIGERAIRNSLQSQLGYLKADATQLGALPPTGPARYPTIIGEIGTPFDMDAKRSYGYTDSGKYKGDYSRQERALDASLNAADGENCLNWTVWTYCPDSSHPWGDGWNMEDLSLWCNDDLRAGEMGRVPGIQTPFKSSLTISTLPVYSSLYANSSVEEGEPVKCEPASLLSFLTNGARAVRAFCRPWPIAVVGTPTNIQFDISKATFRLTLKVNAEDIPVDEDDDIVPAKKGLYKDSSLPTEIFLPLVHFASDACVSKALGRDEPRFIRNDDTSRVYVIDAHSSFDFSSCASRQSYSRMTRTTSLSLHPEGRVELLASEQKLLWFYTVPTGEKEDKELTIEVRRSSGAIKASALGLGYTTESRARDGCAGWLEQAGLLGEGWCPQGCSIM